MLPILVTPKLKYSKYMCHVSYGDEFQNGLTSCTSGETSKSQEEFSYICEISLKEHEEQQYCKIENSNIS